MLRKDFTVDEYQLYESKLLGADAVLFDLRPAGYPRPSRGTLRSARELGISALVETHDAAEINFGGGNAGARLIGVNNRNLKDFSVDFSNAESLRRLIPETALFVAESGVQSPADVAALRQAGADAVLVGEALMRTENRQDMLKQFSGGCPMSRVKIKICGLFRREDEQAVNAAMPDYAGFVFYEKSKRNVSPALAGELRAAIDKNIRTVGGVRGRTCRRRSQRCTKTKPFPWHNSTASRTI